MTEIQPTEDTERRALVTMMKARALSLGAWGLTATAAWWVVDATHEALVPSLPIAAVVLGVMLLASPAGGAATALTALFGRWVDSCPNCADFSVRRIEAEHVECNGCGAERVNVAPFHRETRITVSRADGEEDHYCHEGCR